VPKVGGDTLFANQYAAYDDLPASMKARIENLVGLHHYGNRDDLNETSRTVASLLTDEQKNRLNWVRHRIVRPHPVTGRKALYAVSGSSFGIEGLPDDEAISLLDELKTHATQPKYVYRLKYRVGDVVIWDNASLLHSATLIDPDDARTLWRITVKEPGWFRALMRPSAFDPVADITFLRKRTLLTLRKADGSVVQTEMLDRLRTELLLESLQRFFEIRTDSRLRNERAPGFRGKRFSLLSIA